MCHTCVAEAVLGVESKTPGSLLENGLTVGVWLELEWPKMTEEMRELATLSQAFIELPGCGTGGPLHIITDDYNIDDDSLDFCAAKLALRDPHYPERWDEIVEMGTRIIDLMRPLDEAQRATALAVGDGWVLL